MRSLQTITVVALALLGATDRVRKRRQCAPSRRDGGIQARYDDGGRDSSSRYPRQRRAVPGQLGGPAARYLCVPGDGRARRAVRAENRSSAACTLDSYPQVVLYGSHRAVLLVHYVKGGGAYLTRDKPVAVVLAPGASAYVLVAKYRCDLGEVRTAATVRLTLRAADGGTFAGRAAVGGLGSEDLSYCRGGPRDPG